MITRKAQKAVELSLKQYPVVGILGPRQVGKTTLARAIQSILTQKSVYLDLELPSDLSKLQDPELYMGQFKDCLVIIDEIQRMPNLFPLMRALVDQKRVAGRFLILGSASPELLKHASESLAGRIIYHELSPLTLEETGYERTQQLWLRGGYPLSYLADTGEESISWREAFIKTYLEMDIPQLGIHVPATQLRRFWTMLAHVHGQLWNASQIAKSLGVSSPTVRNYLDILEDTFIVRRLPPFYANIKKRLVKSPKVYIRDSGLLHALLKNRTLDDLYSHPSSGNSWEGFVIEQIIGIIPEYWQSFFYRTSAGAEIDLLLLDHRNESIALEIKYSLSPKVEKGFWNGMEDLGCKKGFVIYPGDEIYPIGKDVFALPVKNMGRIFE
ncbi:MAG: ATP-binding protein [Deltaproteobacteria bacterium]|nr:MAG: ATP-binding protein [Deltaproteobacteria bacterium]